MHVFECAGVCVWLCGVARREPLGWRGWGRGKGLGDETWIGVRVEQCYAYGVARLSLASSFVRRGAMRGARTGVKIAPRVGEFWCVCAVRATPDTSEQ